MESDVDYEQHDFRHDIEIENEAEPESCRIDAFESEKAWQMLVKVKVKETICLQ